MSRQAAIYLQKQRKIIESRSKKNALWGKMKINLFLNNLWPLLLVPPIEFFFTFFFIKQIVVHSGIEFFFLSGKVLVKQARSRDKKKIGDILQLGRDDDKEFVNFDLYG